MTDVLVIFFVGLVGGGLSGLLGIGGGIVTAPLLLYLPGLFGGATLSMHEVGGLTITQALVSSLCGGFTHWRSDGVDRRLAAVMSGVLFVASLAGGAGSRFFSNRFLLGVFLLLALTAAFLMLKPQVPQAQRERPRGEFSTGRAVALALGVGLLGGLVGQGGSFILIPLVTSVLGIPLRVAMGSNMVMIFFASLAGFAGKAATGQIPVLPALALIAGIVPATLAGIRVGRRTPTRTLRLFLAAVIVAACIRMTVDLLH